MIFLTPGEKVRQLRKQLEMRQEDLSSDSLSRPYLSMIEMGKRSLSNNVAKILAQKFNKRAEELHADLHIDADFIIRTPSEDAEKYCLEKLDTAEPQDDLNEIIEISTQFNLENIKAKAYQKLGDLSFDNHDCINAFANYDMALDSCRNANEHDAEPYLYNRLGRCKSILLQYEEALLYYKRANYSSTIYENSKILKLSIYNMAVCYKKLNDVKMALHYIDKCLSMFTEDDDFNKFIYVNILKATCYESENNIDDALSVYSSLINEFPNSQDPLLGIIYNNLGLLYLKKDDYVTSLEYFNQAQKIRMQKDKLNLSHTIIEKSNVFIKQGFYSEAITLIELGLEMAANNNDTEYLLKGRYLLADIYKSTNDYSNLEKTYLTILEILKDAKDKLNEVLKVYNSLSILYLKQNDLNKVNNYLQMSQEVIESC
jgi:HTH-type transcriptional regulator, quorum sensing regulator NprR